MTPGNSSDKPKTYKHTRPDGTTVRVTVPDDPKPEEMLIDAIRDNISPHAVALIAAKCQPCYGKGDAGQSAEREVAWFTEMLIEMVGISEYERLCDDVGV